MFGRFNLRLAHFAKIFVSQHFPLAVSTGDFDHRLRFIILFFFLSIFRRRFWF